MSGKTRITVVMLSAALAFYAIVGGFLWNRSATAKGNQWAQLRIFDEVLYRIVRDYVEEPDMERLRTGALRGLADGLDPYSAYLTPQQVAEYKPVEAGLQNVGGMALSKYGGYLYVVSVMADSPADRSGLGGGDLIEYVGKVATQGISLYDAEAMLSGQQATELKLIRRGQPVTLTYTPGAVTLPALDVKMLEPGVGYIGLPSVSQGRAEQVKAAVAQLESKGAKRLVLDLRGAAYGTLEEGAAVADLFLDSGPIARKVGHNNQEAGSVAAKREDTVYRGPISVLIDRSTAGAGEVVAAALQANNRGDLVGDKTYGAGVELGIFKLRDGGALLMTIERYAPPAGKPFLEEPVSPSVAIARAEAIEPVVPDDAGAEEPPADSTQAPSPENAAKPLPKPLLKPLPAADDAQLKKAIEVLKAKADAATAKAA